MTPHRTVALVTGLALATIARAQAPKPTPDQVRAIAKEAYVYGFPLVDSYRVTYSYFVDRGDPEYKTTWNTLYNNARVYTPADRAVQTPNSDTPYSFLGADLRAEPLVLTLPPIEKGRYYSVQLVDAYTFNFAYLGSRATGNGGGSYLIAGPGWKGEKPGGIASVLRCETELALIIIRTQLFKPDDIENVKKIQAGYNLRTLSEYTLNPAPAPPPKIDFVKPLARDAQRSSLEVFNQLGFVLRFYPTHPSETDLMARFASIGIGAGKTIDVASLPPETKKAMEDGIADAWKAFEALRHELETGKLTSGDLFGTRDFLKNDYLRRMAAAVMGIYGNSKEEAIYVPYRTDADGKPADGSKRYAIHFAKDQLPPVNAFWSVTMYEMPASLLVENPLHRYLINSPMLPDLKRDEDGGVTIWISSESPGKDKESNWLPAPKGPFAATLRMYWPKAAAYDGSWKRPAMKVVEGP